MKLILDFFFALLKNFLVDALAKRIRLFLAVVLVFELLCKSVEIESALIRIGGCLDLIEQIPLRVGRSGVVRTKEVNFDWRLLTSSTRLTGSGSVGAGLMPHSSINFLSESSFGFDAGLLFADLTSCGLDFFETALCMTSSSTFCCSN